MQKLICFIKEYRWRSSFFLVHTLLYRCRFIVWWYRRIKITLLCQGNIGRGTVIEKDIYVTPRSRIKIGQRVFLGRRSILEFSKSSAGLIIGDDTWISHDFHAEFANTLTIGKKVLIGEFVSVRESTHSYADAKRHVKDQKDVYGHLEIQDGVWIGRGSLIIGSPSGITIGKDSIIAANSTVSCSIPSNTIWGGAPARFIKGR